MPHGSCYKTMHGAGLHAVVFVGKSGGEDAVQSAHACDKYTCSPQVPW
jgi:hypothetical protein